MSTELPSNINQLTIPDAVIRARRPEVLYTNAYLNDTIQFNVDQRFIYDSLTTQITELVDNYVRDITGYLSVYINKEDSTAKLSVNMVSPIYSRSAISTFIDREFKELV